MQGAQGCTHPSHTPRPLIRAARWPSGHAVRLALWAVEHSAELRSGLCAYAVAVSVCPRGRCPECLCAPLHAYSNKLPRRPKAAAAASHLSGTISLTVIGSMSGEAVNAVLIAVNKKVIGRAVGAGRAHRLSHRPDASTSGDVVDYHDIAIGKTVFTGCGPLALTCLATVSTEPSRF